MGDAILSQLDSFVMDKYIQTDLSVSKNQFGYHWSYKKGGKKYSVSSKPLDSLKGSQAEFIKTFAKNKAKIIVDDKNIVELWLMVDGSFVSLDEDIVSYKSGEGIRQVHGFNGFTFLPEEQQTEEKKTESLGGWDIVDYKKVAASVFDYAAKKEIETNSVDSDLASLKSLIQAEKQKFAKQESVSVIPAKPSIPFAKKKENLKNFITDFDNQLHKIFKDSPNREINISNDGFITFTMLIEASSQEDKDHKRIVQERNHSGSKLDTIDGEAMFAYLMNPIYEALGFDRREDPDRKHYTGMGDAGDFKYGTTRLDMKTRRKEGGRLCNLLVNKGHTDFNMYGLVLREGDATCEGNQRRLSFVGVASQSLVESQAPKEINKSMKHEVGLHKLTSLRDFIMDVLMEVIQKDES